MTIYRKLESIQAKLKAPKGQYNSFGKYKYRSCEDILEAVKPLLLEYGCVLTISDRIEQIGERYYITAAATLSGVADGEGSISVSASAREEESKKGMDGSQITGAASSYARKYALNGLFCIDDTKDADATNTHGKDKPAKEEYTGSDDDPLGMKPPAPICVWCAKPITDTVYGGKSYTAAEIAKLSTDKHGVPLHIDCADAWKSKGGK